MKKKNMGYCICKAWFNMSLTLFFSSSFIPLQMCTTNWPMIFGERIWWVSSFLSSERYFLKRSMRLPWVMCSTTRHRVPIRMMNHSIFRNCKKVLWLTPFKDSPFMVLSGANTFIFIVLKYDLVISSCYSCSCTLQTPTIFLFI